MNTRQLPNPATPPSIEDPIMWSIYSHILEERNTVAQQRIEQTELLKVMLRFFRETSTNRPDRWEIINLFTNKFLTPPSNNGYIRMYLLLNTSFTFNLDVPGLPILAAYPLSLGLNVFAFPEGTKLQVITPAPANVGAAVPVRFLYTDNQYN